MHISDLSGLFVYKERNGCLWVQLYRGGGRGGADRCLCTERERVVDSTLHTCVFLVGRNDKTFCLLGYTGSLRLTCAGYV